MGHVNIEIKARCRAPQQVREVLRAAGAHFRGKDHQRDTYFQVAAGRLKLREGTLENALIYYRRPNRAGPKRADITLAQTVPNSGLAEVLAAALPVRVVVEKQREIYFLENVKFHIDQVDSLGCFVEIEAIDSDGTIGVETLHRQCKFFMDRFGVLEKDLVNCSYSDLLLRKESS